MSTRSERALNMILVAAAVVATATAIHREFFPTPVYAAPPLGGPPVLESRWEDAKASGTRIGPRDSRVTIVEFADFQCPACRAFHSDLRRVLAQRPLDIGVVLVPFPLPGHEHAVMAAKASLCAEAADKLGAISDLLFDKQDSLGVKSWSSFATDAGVQDIQAFEACLNDPSVQKRVDDARALGVSIQIPGTPTIIVNGWRYTYPPRGDELDQAVERALAGKRPQGAD